MIVPLDNSAAAPRDRSEGLGSLDQRDSAVNAKAADARERRRLYGRAVREDLARKHHASQAAQQASLERRLAGARQAAIPNTTAPQAPLGNSDSHGNLSRKAFQPTSLARLQPRSSPSDVVSTERHKAQRTLQQGRLLHSSSPTATPTTQQRRMISAHIRSPSASAWHSQPDPQPSPSFSQNSTSDLLTPSSSACSSSIDMLPSAWGLHASRKLRRLLRHKQQVSSLPEREAALKKNKVRAVPSKYSPVNDHTVPDPGQGISRSVQHHLQQEQLQPQRPGQQQQQQCQGDPHIGVEPRVESSFSLVDKLLHFEAAGDPFSIINIYLQEQSEKQQAQIQKLTKEQGLVAPCAQQLHQQAGKKQHGVWQQQVGQVGTTASPAMPPLHSEERPLSSASDQENMPANVEGRSRAAQVLGTNGPAPGQGGQLQQDANGAVVAATSKGPALEQAFQVELARLVEIQELELDLAHMEQTQLVGIACKEMDSLQAALDQKLAQRLLLECGPEARLSSPQPQPSSALGAGATAEPQKQQHRHKPLSEPAALQQLHQHRAPTDPGGALHSTIRRSVWGVNGAASGLDVIDSLSKQREQHSTSCEQPFVTDQQAPAEQSPAASQQEVLPAGVDVHAAQEEPVTAIPMAPGGQAGAIGKEQYVRSWLAESPADDQYTEYSADPDFTEVASAILIPANNSNSPTASSNPLLHKLAGRDAPAGAAPSMKGPALPQHQLTGQRQPPEQETAVLVESPGQQEAKEGPSRKLEQPAVQSVTADQTPQQIPHQTQAAEETSLSSSNRMQVADLAVTHPDHSPSTALSPAAEEPETTVPPALAGSGLSLSQSTPTSHAQNPIEHAATSAAPLGVTAAPSAAVYAKVTAPAVTIEGDGSEYSFSFEEDDLGGSNVEFSYTDQYTTTILPDSVAAGAQPGVPALALTMVDGPQALSPRAVGEAGPGDEPAAARLEVQRPASPRQLLRTLSPQPQGSRPTSPSSSRPRPLSPHALDDHYPSPPRSPSLESRPASPTLRATAAAPEAQACIPASASRPGSPAMPDGRWSPDEHQYHIHHDQQHLLSPAVVAAGSGFQHVTELAAREGAEDLQPRSLAGIFDAETLRTSTDAAIASPPACAQQVQQESGHDELVSLPPVTAAAANPPAITVLGSPRVDDDTVVQSAAHARQYVGEVLEYFWQNRAQAYARGEQPLDLEGFLQLERLRAPVGDPQHIFNKLLFDATNEALALHYNKTLTSFAGKVAPERALLDRQKVSQFVLSKVLTWASMDCSAADVSRMLAEDAAEDERTLALLTDMMLAEAQSRAASPAGHP